MSKAFENLSMDIEKVKGMVYASTVFNINSYRHNQTPK